MTERITNVKNIQLEQVVYILLALLLFMLPLSAVMSAGIFFLCFVLALVDGFRRKNFGIGFQLPKNVKYPLLALFCLSCVSVLWSGDVMACAFNWCWVVGQDAGIFYLILRYGAKGHRSLFLMKVFLISAGIVAAYGIWQYFLSNALQDVDWIDHSAFPEVTKRAYATLENPNILGSFLVLAGSYCVGIFAPLKGGKTRVALVIIFILTAICLLLTFSRGNWIAFFWVLFIFSAFFYHKALLPFIGGGLMVLYMGWGLIANRLISIFEMQDTSAELRISYAESALAMIREHPFGVGWYGYQFAFPDYDFYLKDPSVIMYHSHNLFLNIGAELGILGLILFICLMWQLFKIARQIRYKQVKPWVRGIACGYIASLVGLGIGGLSDYTLFNIQMGMLFWAGNAMILLLHNRCDKI
jgi:putative inorganic carbon (HCO3(-)) transporter